MSIETAEEQAAMERVGALVASVLAELARRSRPGSRPARWTSWPRRAFRRAGATSGPAELVGFPASICISVNEGIVHGIPGSRMLREGDLVTLDVTPLLDGYCAGRRDHRPGRPRAAEALR